MIDEKNEQGAMNREMDKKPPRKPNMGLLHAMLLVQAEFPKLKKDADNPFFKSKYVALEQVIETITPILNKHSLFFMQMPTVLESQPALRTRIQHLNGEFAEDTMLLSAKATDPQAQGSAITYARRYSLMSMLGLIGDEDDDG